MINKPTVDTLLEKLSENGEPVSRYSLCVVASKRARQILETTRDTNRSGEYVKEISIACKEIADGKIKFAKD